MLAADVSGPSARLAQIVVRESDRLAHLVDQYLTLARPPPPVLTPLRLDALVSDTVEMLRADPLARGVAIEEKLAVIQALGDASQLRQVLINLLRNAFAAVGRQGRVRVSVEPDRDQSMIQVWDSAGSIPASDLQRIFEPFYSTREGGTGLGLSTVHSIVRAHGGAIEVSSAPEQGTCFTVRLPRA